VQPRLSSQHDRVASPDEPWIDPDDLELIMLTLMRIEAKLEEIAFQLGEEDDGEEEEEADS
jgi:hypothetical protein